MKISKSYLGVGVVLFVAAVGFVYSLHTEERVRKLERRLQQVEGELQFQSQYLKRLCSSQQSVQRVESAPAQFLFVGGNGRVGLDQRIQNIEKNIQPHLETLPPYNPYQ